MLKLDKNLKDFVAVNGCYVNAGQVISKMRIPVPDMTDEEIEMYHKTLKKVVSGKPLNVRCDEDTYLDVFEDPEKIINNFDTDKNYCILTVSGAVETEEELTPYYILAICPVRDSKATLRYNSSEEFRGSSTGSVLGSPMVGITFPSFTGETDASHCMYFFSKDKHEELIELLGPAPKSDQEIQDDYNRALLDVFGDEAPQAAAEVASAFAAENSVSSEDISELIDEKFSAAKADEFRSAFQAENLKTKDTISLEAPGIKMSIRSDKVRTFGTEYLGIPLSEISALNGVGRNT